MFILYSPHPFEPALECSNRGAKLRLVLQIPGKMSYAIGRSKCRASNLASGSASSGAVPCLTIGSQADASENHEAFHKTYADRESNSIGGYIGWHDARDVGRAGNLSSRCRLSGAARNLKRKVAELPL